MRLHVSIGDRATGEWRTLAAWEPDEESTHGPGTLSWRRQLVLPSGEALDFGAVYDNSNQGLSMGINKDGEALVQVGGFKLKPFTYDPSVILLTPDGTHLQLMLGV